jgi:putative salt-induced outer membrane protein YdiY
MTRSTLTAAAALVAIAGAGLARAEAPAAATTDALAPALTVPSLALSIQDGAQAEALAAAAAEARAKADAADADADAAEAAAKAAKVDPDSFWSGWDGSIEAGLNGSDGNSENFNIRAEARAKRVTKAMETSASLRYLYATSDGDSSRHRADAELRNDWNFGESPWGIFALVRGEYDEFQSWKYRTSAFVGPFYRAIDTDRTKLRLRAGVGLTKEYGKQARNEIIPELNLGFDFEHKLTDRQRLYWNFDYYPSLENFSEFRIDTRAGWEITIDPEANLFLRLGVEDRYNSEPGAGKKRNDLDYFATIGWRF